MVRGQEGKVEVSNDKGKQKTVDVKPETEVVVPANGPPAKPKKYKLQRCDPNEQLKPSHWWCPSILPGG